MAYVLYPVPKIALLPVVMLLFGLGNLSKAVVVYLVLFFQVLLSSRDGAREIPSPYILSLRSLGANRWQTLRYGIWPALLPGLLSSLRVGTGTALAVLFFAETFGTSLGLGWFVMECWMRMSYVDMFAGIMCLGLVGLGLFLGIDLLQRTRAGGSGRSEARVLRPVAHSRKRKPWFLCQGKTGRRSFPRPPALFLSC